MKTTELNHEETQVGVTDSANVVVEETTANDAVETAGEILETTNDSQETQEATPEVTGETEGETTPEGETAPVHKFYFENVTPVFRNDKSRKYITTITASALAHLFQNSIIQYKGDIQRGTKTNKTGKVIDVFSHREVKEIMKAMMEDNIHGGMITLNYSTDNINPLEFDAEDSSIKGLDALDVIDGQHRIRACVLWDREFQRNPENTPNPEGFEYVVVVENMSDEQAKSLFAEYALTPAKISKSRAEYLNVKDPSAQLAQKVMKESQLNGRVEVITTSVRGKDKLVTFATLTSAIRNAFKPNTDSEQEKMGAFLVQYFNELVELFPNAFGRNVTLEQREEHRQKSFILEQISWNGYLAIASGLFGKKDWKKRLAKLDEVVTADGWTGHFMSKENSLFRPVFKEGKIINNTGTVNHMTKVLSDYVVGDLSAQQMFDGEGDKKDESQSA